MRNKPGDVSPYSGKALDSTRFEVFSQDTLWEMKGVKAEERGEEKQKNIKHAHLLKERRATRVTSGCVAHSEARKEDCFNFQKDKLP